MGLSRCVVRYTLSFFILVEALQCMGCGSTTSVMRMFVGGWCSNSSADTRLLDEFSPVVKSETLGSEYTVIMRT